MSESVMASIQFEAELKRLPNIIRTLLVEEGNQLVKIVQNFNTNIVEPLLEKEDDPVDVSLALENLDELRQLLAKADAQMAQYHSMLLGYYQKSNESLMPQGQSVADLQAQLEQAQKFNDFASQIPVETPGNNEGG
jgi:hypothetical protein